MINAIRAGIAATRAEVVIITMADLSDDLSVVPRMVELIRDRGYDIVCASRYMKGGRQIGGPRLKGLISRVAGVSLYWLAGLPTHDATERLPGLPPRRARIDPDREPGRVRLYAGDHRQGLRQRPEDHRGSLDLAATASAGQSRFKLLQWLPYYLRWYFYTLTRRPRRYEGDRFPLPSPDVNGPVQNRRLP